MKVYIMSGIPGSGKSTWVRNNASKAVAILSTDNLHYIDGVYTFQANKLAEFHAKVFRDYVEIVSCYAAPDAVIVVDNTNIRDFEILPYYRVAEAFGHDVTVVRMYCDPGIAAARNVHGVPAAKIVEMSQQFSPLPSWYKVMHVFDAQS